MMTEKHEKAFLSICEAEGYCVSAEDAVLTAETIDDFKASRLNYSEPGRVSDLADYEFPAILIEGAQVAKGQTLRDIIVIDFGDFRAVFPS